MAATSFASANVIAADISLPRTGISDGISGANPNKLWLPLWSGEVIHAYDQYNMFESMVTTKSLTGGVTWEFPVTGVVGLNPSWNSGVELGAYSGTTNPTSSSFKVSLDKRPMAAHFETDNIDALITQWDFRSELARQSGITLANTRDKQLAVSLLAACAVQPFSNDPRPNIASAFQDPAVVSAVTSGACTETNALTVLQEIENYLVTCQENDVVSGTIYCVVRPKVFQMIRALGIPRSTGTFTNNPLFTGGQAYGGTGSGFDGMNVMTDTLEYMGVKIIKSNHLPSTAYDVAANNIGSRKYNLNCSATSYVATGSTTGTMAAFSLFGIIFQSDAIAGLSLQGMKVDSIADVRRNTQFTVASMMKGTGIIKPEVCRALIGTTTASVTREILRTHLNGNSVSGAVTDNFVNGFAAEYAQA
ncbi:hypothetical protein UFOVP1192_2 [uncultured Caudovirales phage]|uniref:Uncharacterized protein n=1 Tax=uncultured Caudovirales phage TaxID=2100421 RepID=A0A6J5R4K3_9CAUD|nr:hypothetical protein UFOVP1192_2 [uncultured Caudovirales phage]